MKHDVLDELWQSQARDLPGDGFRGVITKAKKQRQGQFLVIGILSVTLLVLIFYTWSAARTWNDFTLGLSLMIASLVFRVALEVITLHQKENRLVGLDHRSFKKYLHTYYRMRLGINYIITPLCFVLYVIGFLKLLPFFKAAFSEGFFNYILLSGILSLVFLAGIIIRSMAKEHRFLKHVKTL